MVASAVATRLLPVATMMLLRTESMAAGVSSALLYHSRVSPLRGKTRMVLSLIEKRKRIASGR